MMMSMIEILKENGFIEGVDENSFIRNNWTVRLYGDTIEIFNDPDKDDGVYYSDKIQNIVIEDIIEEINFLEE